MIIRPIESSYELNKVYELTYDAYLEKGYIKSNSLKILSHYNHLDTIKETTVLIAKEENEIIGTNTITLDSINGLHCEKDFPLQVQRERWAGINLCCSWRIVTHKDIRDDWRIVYQLIKATTRIFVEKSKICLMTFHPLDALKYIKILNAEVIGFSEYTTGLNNAPALLIKADSLKIPKKLVNINLQHKENEDEKDYSYCNGSRSR